MHLKFITDDDIKAEKSICILNERTYKISISIYDIESNFQSKEIIIPSNELSTLSDATSIQLPNLHLFCISRYNQFRLQYVSIIDMNNLKIKSFQKELQRRDSGIIYYQNFVYLFGGNDIYSINFVQTTEKFDLIENKWTKLSPLPIGSAECDCTVFRNKILITGWSLKKIYEYDILLDSFSELDFIIREFYIKSLIAWKSHVYIIENCGNIYESGYENQYTWSWIANFEDDLYTPVHKVYSEYCIFIGFAYDRYGNYKTFNKYYKFDFKERIPGNANWISRINLKNYR